MRKCFITAMMALFLLSVSSAPAMADGGYYIADGGESLSAVAEAYAMDSQLIALINDLDSESILQTGDLLRLPQNPCFSITVSRGDTLYSLAYQYGVSLEDIQAQNSFISGSRIYEGQQLLIPLTEENAVSQYATAEQPSYIAVYASRSGQNYAWPAIGTISSYYGERWDSFHWGLDIAADHGDAVIAAAAGKVIESGWKNDAYGYAVMIDHGNNCQTLYGHCSSLVAEVGDQVEAGELIAYIGSTGNSTGSHVHFEIRLNGVCVDPLLYLR